MFGDGYWFSTTERDPRAVALYGRHYSSRKNGKCLDDWLRHGFVGPYDSTVLLTTACDALFVWAVGNVERMDHQEGINCTVFRNESTVLSSDLIREAEGIAWAKWGRQRLFTFVEDEALRRHNARHLRNRPPGYCFIMAGWSPCGRTAKRGLTILEKLHLCP